MKKKNWELQKWFFLGKCLFTEKPSTEVLQLDPSFLEDVETDSILGQGRFGTVLLKKFRSTPVAVKYFDISTSPRMVEKEAFQIQQCCHINLPIIYGMPIAPCSLPITLGNSFWPDCLSTSQHSLCKYISVIWSNLSEHQLGVSFSFECIIKPCM